MADQIRSVRRARLRASVLAAAASLGLAACGGTGDPSDPTPGAGPLDAASSASDAPDGVATGATILELLPESLDAHEGARILRPLFHVAPVLPDEPPDVEPLAAGAWAARAPATTPVPAGLEGLPTGGLTAAAIKAAIDARPTAPIGKDLSSVLRPLSVTTYEPQQIRAAYGLPPLPASPDGYARLSPAQAAQYGAGQTIYVVAAFHGPNIAAELAAFNAKFGLPGCTSRVLGTAQARPLPAPSSRACDFAVAYATQAGAIGATPPPYDAGWATEIALDVQWAHAIAPLARIVLVEAVDARVDSLLAAIRLANSFGPGVVSMSFGGREGGWTSSVDPTFTAAGMTYLAATGDSGMEVNWPSVSPNVLAVGGTSLIDAGGASRTETGWSMSGGGVSAFVPAPSYQAPAVPGLGLVTRRSVADVAFNADPSTGQFVATIPPGSTSARWISAGGTSLATPQWAGLFAIANATRALSARAPVGQPHAMLYGSIASVPGSYAIAFADIVSGAHGSCATCSARVGYDSLGGLGTPNAAALVAALAGAAPAPEPPVVTPATVSGQVGTPLSFTASVKSPRTPGFTLSGAPAGMVIDSTGVVTWPKPVAGTYRVTVTARDPSSGLTGSGVYTVSIAAPRAPAVTGATVDAKAGVALSYAVAVSAPNPVTWTLAGAPAGMTIGAGGVIAWPLPVAGTYRVTAKARDAATRLEGSGAITIRVAAAQADGVSITAAPMSGRAGKSLTGTITVSAPGASRVSTSIAGVPLGMTFSIRGATVTATWAKPRAGDYALSVTARDSLGRSSQATVPVTIR
jgi:hypothetical protein